MENRLPPQSRIIRTLESVINATGESAVPGIVLGVGSYIGSRGFTATQNAISELGNGTKTPRDSNELLLFSVAIGAVYFAKIFCTYLATPYDKRNKVFRFNYSTNSQSF